MSLFASWSYLEPDLYQTVHIYMEYLKIDINLRIPTNISIPPDGTVLQGKIIDYTNKKVKLNV